MFKVLIAFVTVLFAGIVCAKQPTDGTYDARVRSDGGSYRVPVDVEDGEVTKIHWPNGGRMRLRGAEIEDGEASGINSRDERFQIELEDLEYDDADGDGDDDD